MKKIKTKGKNEDAATFATWDCGCRLYDSYELVSLNGSKRPMTGISHPTDFTPVSIADPTSKSIAKESSSLRSSSRELHESKCWKKRRFGQRRDTAIKLRSGFSCFCNNPLFPSK
uniref:Uncharacterized protein n=1 Tax=Gossypium raimondii TaxID=29730 RepID=A0A0D2P6Y5_GOSRA|nr:hypothetical protein B456_007G106700 [Gossypium raimondii]